MGIWNLIGLEIIKKNMLLEKNINIEMLWLENLRNEILLCLKHKLNL